VKAAIRGIAACTAFAAAAAAFAGEDDSSGRRVSRPEKPSWEFGVTAYPTSVRGGDHYTVGIAVADRGPLHLEARYDYEGIGARSAFVGWTFAGGETLKWELTPMLGGAGGTIHASVPAFEASLAWKRLDFYIEGESVRNSNAQSDSYGYAWSELGFKAMEWLRLGAVAQRTKAYGGERELQRGPFGQATWGRVTFGAYWFNPGSKEQVFVASIGAKF
jgi:hypothetical protein